MIIKSYYLYGTALLTALLATACSSNDNNSSGGGSPGTGAGTGGSNAQGGSAGTGGSSTGGNAGGTGGASGGGTGGARDAGTGGTVDASTGAGGGTGAEGGLVLGGTATRPLLSSTDAAQFTILSYLAQTGSVAAPTSDPWDPMAGVTTSATPDFIVDASGGADAADGGTFTTVQAAITAATLRGGTNRLFIQVMPGTYREVVCVRSGPPITLFAADSDAGNVPTIVFNNLAGTSVPDAGVNPPCFSTTYAATYGTDNSATFSINSPGFQAKNLVISNDGNVTTLAAGNNGTQGVALHTRGDRAIFENVRFLGHQDTVEVKTNATGGIPNIARTYFKNSYVEGDVDFIFGRGTAVFDQCEIHVVTDRLNNGVPRTANNNVVAPSTDARYPFGILFIAGNFTAAADAQAGRHTLGRAYDEGFSLGDAGSVLNAYAGFVASGTYTNGQAVIRDSTIGAHINVTAPWTAAATSGRTYSSISVVSENGGSVPANRLYEFNNSGPGAAPTSDM